MRGRRVGRMKFVRRGRIILVLLIEVDGLG